MRRFVTETDDTGKSSTVTMPEYVNRICADNTAQAEQLVEYRDFMRDMCHALGMSLESTFADVLRRVEKLKVASPSAPSEKPLTRAQRELYSVATAEDWAAKYNNLSVKLLTAHNTIAELAAKLKDQRNTSAWAVEGRNELLEEYRRDNALLNRQVEEYRSVAFGLWNSLEKARSSEPPVQVAMPSDALFPGNWVEV